MVDTAAPALSGRLPQVSVVIPAFNEERHIPALFGALAAQDCPAGLFEVILVDNGSTDRTLELASGFTDYLDVRTITKPGGSIAEVRNSGACLARGEVLVFLDSDCIAPPSWLRLGLAYRSPGLLWGAHYRVRQGAGWVANIWEEFQAQQSQGQTSFIPSGNLWIERSSFEKIGRFSTTLETSEDVELCQRAMQQGLCLQVFPELSVVHLGSAETLKSFYLQNRWHGKHVLRMFLRNLPQLTYLPLVLLSLYTLLMCVATIAGAGWAIVCRSQMFFTVPLAMLLLPSLLLAISRTAPRNRLGAVPELFALYFTYLLARAAALIQPPVRNHR